MQIQFDEQQKSIRDSYNILGNLLSSAENFAGMPNNQYGYYNISKAKSKEDLRQEFAWELHCFQLSLEKLLEKYNYNEYPYPAEAPKGKILEDIKMWKSRIKKSEDKLLFDAMKDIINGKKPQMDYDEIFDSLDSNKKFNPKRLKEIIPPLNYTLDQIVDHANEREKIGKPPSFHVGEKMPYNSGMYKLKNSGNYDYYDNLGKNKNPNNNDYWKENEKLYEITLCDNSKIKINNLDQVNFHYKYIVLDNQRIKFKDIKEIK